MCIVFFPSSSTDRKRMDSFVDCEGLDTFGRYSYNGCNKEIEVGIECMCVCVCVDWHIFPAIGPVPPYGRESISYRS